MRSRKTRSPQEIVGFAVSLILCCGLVTFSAAAQTVTTGTTLGTKPGAGTLSPTSPNQTRLGLPPPTPNCLKANPFDTQGTDFVIQKITAAGYSNVRGLYKGCDALWRGHALQNGIDTAIMVTPTGQVIKNGYGAFVAPAPVTVPSQ
jgi:hypothetical protein